MSLKVDFEFLKETALKASEEILEIYHNEDFSGVVDFKDDNSPLTLADKASHKIISEKLSGKYPDIPLISEEGQQIEYQIRKDFEYYWLIDPLDGTKEFIKRNGEFTINIALMNRNTPVAGLIYVPVKSVLYYGDQAGAFKIEHNLKQEIEVSNRQYQLTAVRSASHATPEEDEILKQYDVVKTISRGSSLKFCMVAEGSADIYYRHGPTMEWDTAAGQAIVLAAGGKVLNKEGKPFAYKKENMLNGSFLCMGRK